MLFGKNSISLKSIYQFNKRIFVLNLELLLKLFISMEENKLDNSINLLKRILIYESPILFTGAGFSLGGRRCDNEIIYSGKELKEEIIVNLLKYEKGSSEYEELKGASLTDVSEMCKSFSPNRLEDYLTEVFSNCFPAPFHEIICKYKWKKIYTTNIDDLIENTIPPAKIIVQNLNRPKISNFTNKIEYIKLHGCVKNPSMGYVFSGKDYVDSMLNSRDYRFNSFGQDIQYEHFIFIGTDYNEVNLDYYLKLYENSYSQTTKGQLFFINPNKSIIFNNKIKRIGGHVLPWTTEQFSEFLNDNILKQNIDVKPISIYGFYNYNDGVEKLKKYSNYRSNLYLGNFPTWLDIYHNWDFRSNTIEKDFNTYYNHLLSKNIKHSMYCIVGKSMSGKSVYLKRLGSLLYQEGFQILEFRGKTFDYMSIIMLCKDRHIDKLCLIVDNASYYYGALRSLLRSFPANQQLIILTASRPYFHNRKKYNIITEDYFEYNIVNEIDEDFATEIEKKLYDKGYLGTLKNFNTDERIRKIKSSNDVASVLFNITYGKGFYARFKSDLNSRFNNLEVGKDLLVYISIFQALDLSYFPLEIVTLIFNDITKDALNEIDDFIKYNENNGVSIRNTFLSKLVLQQVRHNKLLELIKEILIHISPQVTENLHTYWNEIEATLMKEKLLRKRLGLKTSSIKNMLFEIQSYYNDNYNYWIQVGISEQMDNEFEKALNHFQQAEALNPNSYMVKNAIARNFLKQANSCKIIGSAKPYFEEGERRMLELIKEREEFQVKAYSTHCYLYEKINYFENFNIVPNDDDLKKMYDLLETIIEKTPEDGMSKHISNKFFNFLKKINKTYILNIKFYDLSVLKLMFEKYDIDTDIFEDFEIDG